MVSHPVLPGNKRSHCLALNLDESQRVRVSALARCATHTLPTKCVENVQLALAFDRVTVPGEHQVVVNWL